MLQQVSSKNKFTAACPYCTSPIVNKTKVYQLRNLRVFYSLNYVVFLFYFSSMVSLRIHQDIFLNLIHSPVSLRKLQVRVIAHLLCLIMQLMCAITLTRTLKIPLMKNNIGSFQDIGWAWQIFPINDLYALNVVDDMQLKLQ